MDTWIFGALVKIDFTIPSNESWDTSASVSTFNIIAGSLILARIDGVTFIDSFPQFYDIFLNVLYFNLKKYTIAFLKSLNWKAMDTNMDLNLDSGLNVYTIY